MRSEDVGVVLLELVENVSPGTMGPLGRLASVIDVYVEGAILVGKRAQETRSRLQHQML